MSKDSELERLRQQREKFRQNGRDLTGQARWQEALTHYAAALTAHRELYERARLQSDKFNVLGEDRFLYGEAAYVAARTGDARRASLILETGRAQILGEAWMRDHVFVSRLNEVDVQLAAEHTSATARLAELERRERNIFRDTVPGSADIGPSLENLRGEVQAARDELERVLKAARQFVSYENFCAAQTLHDFETVVKEGSALVYISTTVFGSFAAIVAPSADRNGMEFWTCWMDEFTQADLFNPVGVIATGADSMIFWTVGSTLRAANALSQTSTGDHWLEVLGQLETVQRYVGQKLVAPLAAFLSDKGLGDIVLVQCGDLAQVPLQVAPFIKGDKDVTLIDHFDVRLAPSAKILEMCRCAAVRTGDAAGECTVIQSPDLPGTAYEANVVQSLWPDEHFHLITDTNIDRVTLQESLRSAEHVVFSCHGYFRYWDQLSSAFVMDGRLLLDLRDMLNESWLPNCRLVVASTCMSGFEDSSTTFDECISLTLGLFCTGAAAVISSQWNVEDLVAAIFVTRFHQELFADDPHGKPPKPWATFCRVQRWLKNVSVDELTGYVESVPTLNSLHQDYLEDFGPGALTKLFASEAERSEDDLNRLKLGAHEQARSVAAGPGDADRLKMRSWFWGAWVSAGA